VEAKEFKQRVEEAMKLLSDYNGPSANTGVGFFIGDMEDLFEEWQSEEHEYGM